MVTHWTAIGQFVSLSLLTVPEVFAKVTSAQFPKWMQMSRHVQIGLKKQVLQILFASLWLIKT